MSAETNQGDGLHGIIAEFTNAHDLLEATHKAKSEGYNQMDAYSPVPVHGLSEALGQRYTLLPWLVFLGGLAGGIGIYSFMYWASVIDYPLITGGKPLHSWPAFIPITFEATVLVAGITATLGMFALNKLPQPHHPVFNAPGFDRASTDRFFLCIEADDPKFDAEATKAFLQTLGAEKVSEVEDS